MNVAGVSRVHLGYRLQQRPREKSKEETQMKQSRQAGAAVVITVAMATVFGILFIGIAVRLIGS